MKMKNEKKCAFLTAGLLVLILSSCIGVKADITFSSNGSGTIELEYRLSRLAESLGKLDGNERRPTIPLGKADFERTVARVQGLTLRSFSAKNDGQDTINTVKLEFSNPQALVSFLDATGQRASLVEENGKHRLSLTLISTLISGNDPIDPDLLTLFTAVSQGYSISLSFTAPRAGTLTAADANGKPLGDILNIVPKGKKVSFQSSLGDLYTLTDGADIELIWE